MASYLQTARMSVAESVLAYIAPTARCPSAERAPRARGAFVYSEIVWGWSWARCAQARKHLLTETSKLAHSAFSISGARIGRHSFTERDGNGSRLDTSRPAELFTQQYADVCADIPLSALCQRFSGFRDCQ
jgi:hypothetical protein